jgi:hypothetical protein
MIFNNINLLSYDHENSFWGEKSFQYSSKKIFGIRGYVLDLANDNGVEGVFNQVLQLINNTKEFQNVIINGEAFGRGKIVSFSVDNGNWVKLTEYNATVEVYETCSLTNLNSPEFSSINLNNQNIYLLKNFSENFSVNFDTQNKVVEGEHSIEIEYDANNSTTPLIVYAQTLARELLKTLPTSVKESNYSVRNNFKVYNSENYNLIDGRCGFRKRFSYNNENVAQNYSVKRSLSLNLNEEGIATVTENCEIKGEFDVPSLYENAYSGLNTEINGAKSRCDGFFNTYKTKFGISRNLNNVQIEKTVKINKFNGVINYTVSFDNDKKRENNSYTFESVQTLERNEKGVWNASESGEIIGHGGIDINFSKYTSAESGWNTVKGNILSRIQSFYNGYATSKPSNPSLKLLSTTINRSKYQGTISYDYVYTDDEEIQNNTNGISKTVVERTDTGLRPITKAFIIPNSPTGYPVLQNRSLLQQGTYTVTVELEIGCLATDFNSKSFYNQARSLATYPGVGNDSYLDSINYSTDEIERTIRLTATYLYS